MNINNSVVIGDPFPPFPDFPTTSQDREKSAFRSAKCDRGFVQHVHSTLKQYRFAVMPRAASFTYDDAIIPSALARTGVVQVILDILGQEFCGITDE